MHIAHLLCTKQYMTVQPPHVPILVRKKEFSADSLWLSEYSPVLRGMISGMLCTINVYSSSQLDSVSNGRNSALYLPTHVIVGY